MIVIEPYPGKVRLPIIVPGGPEVEIPARPPAQAKSSLWKWGLLAGVAGLIYSARGSRTTRLSGAGKQPAPKRLYYMWRMPGGWIENSVNVPKKRLKEYQQRAISTRGDLYYVWAESADRARNLLKRSGAATEYKYQRPSWKTEKPPYRKDKQLTLFGALGGRIANCAIWIPREGDDGWTCGAYGRVCDSPTCAAPGDPKARQSKVCVQSQSVFSAFYDHMITRCKRYEPTCQGPACMPEPMPYPKAPPVPREAPAERREPSKSEVKSLAQWMAEEYNEQTFGKEPYIAREILSRGGIKPPRRAAVGLEPKKRQAEEYTAIPLFLRNKKGLPMDEMAAEMGYEYEDDLRQDIAKAYPPKKTGAWRWQRRKTWEEFENAAFEQIEEGLETGTWTGLFLGQDLFPELKRELVLEPPEDPATSDDPVMACMERLGWRIPRMQMIRASISEKMTPDLFTGKTTRLSPGEKDYQRAITGCLKSRSGTAGLDGALGAAPGLGISIQAQAVRASQRDTKAMSKYLSEAGIEVNKDQTVTLYHGTTEKKAAGILEDGKIRGTAGKNVRALIEKAAWLTPDREFAKIWGQEVVTVRVPVLYIRHMAQNFKEFYFEGGLKRDVHRPAEWIPERYPREDWVIKQARKTLLEPERIAPQQLRLLGNAG